MIKFCTHMTHEIIIFFLSMKYLNEPDYISDRIWQYNCMPQPGREFELIWYVTL